MATQRLKRGTNGTFVPFTAPRGHSIVLEVRRMSGQTSTAQASNGGAASDAYWGRTQPVRMWDILLGRFQSNVIVKRIGLANTYGGGIFMTTLILISGHSTPRLLRWIARRLAYVAR